MVCRCVRHESRIFAQLDDTDNSRADPSVRREAHGDGVSQPVAAVPALDQVDAVGAFDLLGVHLPFMRLFRSVCQNHQAMQQGRDLDVAIRHVAYDTLVQGGLTVASATLGGKLGTALAGPLGTLAGTVLGGVAGSVVGGEWAMALKRRPLELALTR